MMEQDYWAENFGGFSSLNLFCSSLDSIKRKRDLKYKIYRQSKLLKKSMEMLKEAENMEDESDHALDEEHIRFFNFLTGFSIKTEGKDDVCFSFKPENHNKHYYIITDKRLTTIKKNRLPREINVQATLRKINLKMTNKLNLFGSLLNTYLVSFLSRRSQVDELIKTHMGNGVKFVNANANFTKVCIVLDIKENDNISYELNVELKYNQDSNRPAHESIRFEASKISEDRLTSLSSQCQPFYTKELSEAIISAFCGE